MDKRTKANAKLRRIQKVAGYAGLYQDTESGTYLRRVQASGRNTYQSLGTSKKPQAIKTLDDLRLAKVAADHGMAIQQPIGKAVNVAAVIDRYTSDEYPDKKGNARKVGPHRRGEEDYCQTLKKWFSDKLVPDLSQNLLDEYHTWRVENVTKGDGHRTTDLELNTLSNALNWAVRKQLIKTNPISSRIRFHSPSEARHCKELAPADIDELHAIAGVLFRDRRSEVLGWQYLFEAMTGLRNEEALLLRMDARPDAAGGVTADGKSLCVHHVKEQAYANPYVLIHDGLRQALDAHKAWHAARYPNSPWYFPGRTKRGGKSIGRGSLTHRLHQLFEGGLLKKKFTSHGARAFYVFVRRSQGAADAHIAWEINHIGGVSTLEKVYGGVPQHWRDGKGPNMPWVPKGRPA